MCDFAEVGYWKGKMSPRWLKDGLSLRSPSNRGKQYFLKPSTPLKLNLLTEVFFLGLVSPEAHMWKGKTKVWYSKNFLWILSYTPPLLESQCCDGGTRLPDNDRQPPLTWEINSLTGGHHGAERAKSPAWLPAKGAAGCLSCFNETVLLKPLLLPLIQPLTPNMQPCNYILKCSAIKRP